MIIDQLFTPKKLYEFARGEGGGDSGNYFKALASAWYNGTYDSGSLQKGIKTKEDIERLLDRGIVAPDGVTRKYNIDYNSDFDGVIIFSDDYYEHGDDDETDSRTGQPFGPYDYMEFSDDDLSESAMAEGRKKKKTSRSLGRYFFPGYGYYGSGDAGEGGGDGGGGESAMPGMAEGEYDSRKPFGVRYKVFAGREGRMTTREYWTSSEEKLQRAVDKIQALDNFYEIDGYSYPKESQGVADRSRIPTLNQLLKTSSPSPKDTYYIVQGSVADEEGRDVTVFNIYYNDKSVFGPYYNPKSATRKLHQLRADGHEVIGERVEQGVAEGEQDPQSELKLINQKLKDAYKHVRNNSSVSIGWYMSQVKELKARREELIKQLKQGVAEGLTEMDKSEPSAGRDGSPRPGPDREAKPISKEKMTKDAADVLDKAMSKEHKKKDVTESDTLMLKLQRAMVQEGRVKELADDLKTMPDADFMKKYGKVKAAIRKDMKRVDEAPIDELSTNKLAQYKTAAARDAQTADKAGDFKRGDKRLHGIVKATKKQFDNDAKKVDESRAARQALMAQIVNGN